MRASHLLVLSVLIGGCEPSTDNSINYLPMADGLTTYTMDASEAEAETSSGDPADTTGDGTQPCDCMTVGAWYQFDSLGLTAIDGKLHPVMNTLNPLWEADINNREINLFMEVLEVTPTEVQGAIYNGARVGKEGDVCMRVENPSVITFGRDGCKLTLSTPGSLSIYAGDAANPKMCAVALPLPHAIPVKNVALEVKLNDTCTVLSDGVASQGFIAKDDLFEVCTCVIPLDRQSDACEPLDPTYANSQGLCQGCNGKYQNLEALLSAFQKLDYLCVDENGEEAVCLDAFFSMVSIDATPTTCVE